MIRQYIVTMRARRRLYWRNRSSANGLQPLRKGMHGLQYGGNPSVELKPPTSQMMKCRFFFLILCLVSAHVTTGDETKKIELAESTQDNGKFQYDGIWKPKGAMLGGVLLPPSALKAITLRIAKDKYEVTVDGEDHSDMGTFSLDETTTPKRMTINSTAGPNKGKTFLAIYEIKGADAMRVCYDLSGSAFPKEFKAPKDSKLYLVGYRRQVPTANDTKDTPATTSDVP